MANNEEIQINPGQYNYQNNFHEICKIGEGGFGKVFKVKDKLDEQTYAVKIIELEILEQDSIEKFLKEPKTMAQLNSDKAVRYMNTWIEESRLFIKMEYCTDNIRNLIKNKHVYFGRGEPESLNVLEYHISCKIFEELLEAVQYLHESNPQIIHRDIKPENILISKNSNNRKCLKIADFGLAVFQGKISLPHSSNMGTLVYMAPEVFRNDYDTKADVYSLGRIAEELFQVDTYKSEQKSRPHLAEKYGILTGIIISMTNNRACERPSCSDVLANFANIQVPGQKVKEYQNFESMRENLVKNVEGDSILLDYLSNLDVQEQMFPVILGQFVNTFKNLVVKQQLDNSDSDDDDDPDEFNFDLPWVQPVVSLLNPNHKAVRIFSTFFEQMRDVPEKVRNEKQKIKKRK